MRITIEVGEMELNSVLLDRRVILPEFMDELKSFKLDTVFGEFNLVLTEYSEDGNGWFGDYGFVFETCVDYNKKSQQELQAEGAVKAAQKSLEAAKETLAKVKEGK